jgi:hypothetical protein
MVVEVQIVVCFNFLLVLLVLLIQFLLLFFLVDLSEYL